MTDGKKSPILQKYFENDPPSFFDQIKGEIFHEHCQFKNEQF